MKKVFKFFAAALAIVAAASCAKELSDNNTTQTPDQELVHKVFSASLNVDSDTKTTLHTDGASVHWTEDDVIKLIPKGSAYGTDFSVVSCDGSFADFEGETVNADSYRAVYPASALLTESMSGWYSEKNYYIFADRGSNCALAHQYAVENNFSIIKELGASSNFALSTSSENDHLYFKNLNAYLKVRLAMDNAASIEVSADKVLSHSSGGAQNMLEGAKLGGPVTIDFNHSNKIGVLAGYGEDVTFKKADGSNLLSGDDIYYYIAIPAVKIEGLKLVVKDANGKVLQTLTKQSTFTAEPNMIYNLGVIEEAKVEPAKVGDYFYSDGTYSTALDNSNSKTVVGVVFALVDATSTDSCLADSYPGSTTGLVVGIEEYSSVFGDHTKDDFSSGSTYVYFKNNGWPLTPRDDASQEILGYTHTQALIGYKAFRGGNYAALVNVLDGLTSPQTGSAWYIPSFAEMKLLKENMDVVNDKLTSVGAPIQTSGYYWPSTLMKGPSYNDLITQPFNMSTGTWKDASDKWDNEKTKTYPVRVVFAF